MVVPFGSAADERRSRTTYRPTVTARRSTIVNSFTGTTSSVRCTDPKAYQRRPGAFRVAEAWRERAQWKGRCAMPELFDTADAAPPREDTAPLHLPHAATECPKCFTELQRDRDWWLARPAGSRLFGRLVRGDVLVVTNVHALGRNTDEETRTVAELARRGVVVKVLRHGAHHLHDALD